MNYIELIPIVLSIIAIVLAGRAWYITGRTQKNLDEYHRKRGDIPRP